MKKNFYSSWQKNRFYTECPNNYCNLETAWKLFSILEDFEKT